ncbi:hypothetical protein NDU88_004211 [Pleurodeles waltl]|uniref:Uncharacterized protein n=1 Tax=Pleurodeles waltl TaxID=8319 RepID=A0AAV7SI58_PLEWA|nr:hypothetical protein NDU88_004211 [Pleurodeles waltl]
MGSFGPVRSCSSVLGFRRSSFVVSRSSVSQIQVPPSIPGVTLSSVSIHKSSSGLSDTHTFRSASLPISVFVTRISCSDVTSCSSVLVALPPGHGFIGSGLCLVTAPMDARLQLIC